MWIFTGTTGKSLSLFGIEKIWDRKPYAILFYGMYFSLGGTPSKSASVPITVFVTDINDNAPQFTDLNPTAEVHEAQHDVQDVFKVKL